MHARIGASPSAPCFSLGSSRSRNTGYSLPADPQSPFRMTHPQFDADWIIVGSGPAGVSAAFPLVAAGVRVLMIDGAGGNENHDYNVPWKRVLGEELEALLPEDGVSPKLRTPAARRIVSDFARATGVRGEGFVAIGAK